MKSYDWKTEEKEVRRYSHRSVSELSALYRKYPKNLNIKFAYMQRLYYGDDVDKMDDEDEYRARKFHDYNEDEPKALKLLDELLMMNHGSSMVFSANGYVIKKPLEERVEILNQAIDLGFLPALDELAHLYCKDKDKEIKVHKRGMELGYPKSYIDMAYFLDDKEKKEEYISFAADVLNSGLAQYVKAKNYRICENYNESFKEIFRDIAKIWGGRIKMRKVLAILLCVAILLPCVCIGVSAEENHTFYKINIDSGSGTIGEKAIVKDGEIYISADSFSNYTRFSFDNETKTFLIKGQELKKAFKSVVIDIEKKRVFVSGKKFFNLSNCFEIEGEIYLPLCQMLPVLNADIYEVRDNTIYISNNKLSLAEVLYDFDISDYYFNISAEFYNMDWAALLTIVPNYVSRCVG